MAVRKRGGPGLILVIALVMADLVGVAFPAGARQASPAAEAPGCPAARPVPGAATEGVTVGYAGLSGEFPFVQDVNGGMERAAGCFGVNLIIADNEYDPQKALQVADDLIAHGIVVAIEFQTDVSVAPVLCSRFESAGVPVIAIDIPHPCAFLVGANNLEAGRMAGANLARVANERWGGDVDALVVLEMPMSSPLPSGGPLVSQRVHGVVDGVTAGLPGLSGDQIIRVDGAGSLEESRTAMADVLTRLADADRILVAAVNDASAIGALRAVEQAGRTDPAIVAGQGATVEARDELCAGTTGFIGSVAFFPERYGDKLIPLAIDLANGAEPPPEVFTEHVWIDGRNVRQYYPGECP